MGTLANGEDPYVSSRSTLFAKMKTIFKRKKCNIIINLEIISCDPSLYTMDHLKFIVLNQKEESISHSE